MKRLIQKIKNKFLMVFYGLFYGMKATEDVVFHQSGNNEGEGTSIQKEVENTRISKALLKA